MSLPLTYKHQVDNQVNDYEWVRSVRLGTFRARSGITVPPHGGVFFVQEKRGLVGCKHRRVQD